MVIGASVRLTVVQQENIGCVLAMEASFPIACMSWAHACVPATTGRWHNDVIRCDRPFSSSYA